MATTAYRVIKQLAIVRDDSGVSHHLYEGALLPLDADSDHVEQLLDTGYIEKVSAAEAKAAESPSGGK